MTRPRTSRFPATRLWAEPLEPRCTPATFLVTNTLDAGPGSLRVAILRANATPAADRIAFAIPAADPGFVDADHDGRFDPGDYWSIAPASALPAVTHTLRIDGGAQRGPGYRGVPVIELDGTDAGAGVDGLTLRAHAGSTVRGLAVNRFDGNGIRIHGGGKHTIAGDFLGTDPSGRQDRGNRLAGLSLTDSARNTIGGTGVGQRNLISGNDLQGVHIEGDRSVANRVVGNLVGTTISGDTALGNGTELYLGDGIRVEGGRFNVIGGRTPAERNVVSGNFDDGIDLRDGARGNVVKGNYIGTDAAGTRPLGNGIDGVYLENASFNLVGSLITGDANVIAGNGYNGVFLYGDSHHNAIVGNFIGTNARRDDLGNGTVADFSDGVFLAQFGAPVGPANNAILQNTIAFNADSAVAVAVDPAADVAGNSILSNSIFGNGGVAIDLASDGPTPNDPGDADGGPNRLQNYPVLQAPVADGGSGRIVRGTLGSTPRTAFRVEFFASSRAGEGEVFLGSMIVFTRADGTTPVFSFRYAAVRGKPFLTSTATSLGTGDTSEFSPAVVEV